MNEQNGLGMERFEYADNLDQKHIRIIELLPGSKDDRIKIKLTTELRQNTEYTYDAISYVWGDPTATKEIICDDKILAITTSLEGALRMIRSHKPDKSQWLWADAICINQKGTAESHTEKNNQVRLMGQVYQSARRVLAWLGPEERPGIAGQCFQQIQQVNEILAEHLKEQNNPKNFGDFKIVDQKVISPLLKSLMNCSWFTRVWILQEAGLAKDCVLLWGEEKMSFAELIELACFCEASPHVARMIGYNNRNLFFWSMVFQCIFRTYDNATSWRHDKPLMASICKKYVGGLFLDVLHIGKSLSATDPRDHVFAFLGSPLARGSDGSLMLQPNYDIEESQIFLDTACALLGKKEEASYVLCFVQHNFEGEVTRARSWVPRWNSSKVNSTYPLTIGNIGVWHEAGGPVDRLHYQILQSADVGSLLSLQGIFFDQLIWISDPLQGANFALDIALYASDSQESNDNMSHQAYINMLWKKTKQALDEISGLNKTEKYYTDYYMNDFSITLVAGYKYPRHTPLREHRKKLKAYLNALDGVQKTLARVESDQLSRNKSANAARYETYAKICDDRRLALTKDGHIALVPLFARPGDLCCVMLGMVTPFVVRLASNLNEDHGKLYHLVGEAYVHGIMAGELVDALDNGEITEEEITLV